MKIRNSFVSNSSSTSYTCEACGHEEAGYDSISAKEYGFGYCIVEHCVCLSCMGNKEEPPQENEEEWNKWADETEEGEFYPAKSCPICQFETISQYNMIRYLKMKANLPNPHKTVLDEFSSLEEFQKALKEWEDENKK